ncbi:MAG: hypothetical protein AAF614_09265 [Chloroflexota bacterium]
MNRLGFPKRLLSSILLLILLTLYLGLAWLVSPVAAQSCSHVTFQIDAAVSLDETAVCNAAEQWRDQGIQTFIYVTDVVTQSEDDWYVHLDGVETARGFRTGEAFDSNVLAYEVSTSGDTWASTLTYGSDLFDTPFDQNENQRLEIAENLLDDVLDGNLTSGFSTAINAAYDVSYGAAFASGGSETTASGSGVGGVVTTVAAVGALGVGGYFVNRQVVQPALARRKKREEQEAHLGNLRQNVANLLLACERLLSGDKPEEAILYQVFEAYGGVHYEDRKTAVYEWIRRSQAALDAAFNLRRDLIDEDNTQSLTEQIRSWETIYLTLVGSSERVQELTDEELHDLLDPMITLERETDETPLVKQLVDLQRELQGKPLKVELQEVDPTSVDQEGILGYVDQVEQQLNELMAAQGSAPDALDKARRARLDAEKEVDDARPFGLTATQLMVGLDARLAKAKKNLDHGVYLDVLSETESADRDLDIIDDMMAAEAGHAERQNKISQILQQGYRPVSLAPDRELLAEQQEKVRQSIEAGDYVEADSWVDEFDASSNQTLQNVEQWRNLHQINLDQLERLGASLVHIKGYYNQEAVPAWRGLQNYPDGNWKSVTQGLNGPQETLKWLEDGEIARIRGLNSMQSQQFPDAESALVAANGRLMQAERQLQTVVNRLAEIKTAENNIRDGIKVAKKAWEKTAVLRDAEDRKIGPEIDQMLDQAQTLIDEAGRYAKAREFIAAAAAQTKSRHLSIDAYDQATEQVRRINRLQTELDKLGREVVPEAERVLRLGDALPAVIMTPDINTRLQELGRQLSEAKRERSAIMSQEDHALTAALEEAVDSFKLAEETADLTATLMDQEQKAYKELGEQAEAAIQRARVAIEQAEKRVKQRDGGAGASALRRAQDLLPSRSNLQNASKDRLAQVRGQADKAADEAALAERKAEESIREAQRRREREWQRRRTHSPGPIIIGGNGRSQRSGGGWSSPRPSRPRISSHRSRSSSRSRSRSSSRRTSSRSSSRRTSSRGRSRR